MERKEAIKVIKKNWPDSSFTMLREALETLIPELKESKDERIRKALISNYQGDGCICTNEYRIDFKDIRAWLEKQWEQKPTEWSEEDEERLRDIINELVVIKEDANVRCSERALNDIIADINWLNSLKDRVQPKLKWSEEDEEIHRKCICAMRASACGFPEEEKFVEQVNNWLKSLKERYTWRPSDRQMDALGTYIYNPQYFSSPDPRMELVESVYKDLKKLREE